MKRKFAFVLAILTLSTALSFAEGENEYKPAYEPWIIDDQDLFKTFENKMAAAMEAGLGAEPSVLKGQLSRTHCEVNLPKMAGPKLDATQIYQQSRKSILGIGGIFKCDRCTKWHPSVASGFAITDDGVVVTNYHVIENMNVDRLGAMTDDGQIFLVEEVLAANKEDDIAIIKLKDAKTVPLVITPDEQVGSDVFAISNPDNRLFTMTKGIISRYFWVDAGQERSLRMAITADYARGSSGAPILGVNGGVVGLVSATQSIYYTRTPEGEQKELQMVCKLCIPSKAILDLISNR